MENAKKVYIKPLSTSNGSSCDKFLNKPSNMASAESITFTEPKGTIEKIVMRERVIKLTKRVGKVEEVTKESKVRIQHLETHRCC